MARHYLSGPWERLADRLPAIDFIVGHAEAGLLRSFWAVCGRLSPEAASNLGGSLLRRLGPQTRQHRKLTRNLATAFPDWTSQRLEATARDSWDNVGRVLAEYPHLDAIVDAIEVNSQIDLSERRAAGRPVVLVSGHFGNWELSASMARRLGIPLTVIYSEQHNTAIDRALQKWRAVLGCNFIEKDAKVHSVLSEIRSGRSLGMLIDQRYDTGDSVPFFGHDAPVPLAPATLAVRLGLDLLPARIVRLGGCRFRLDVGSPIDPDMTLTNNRDIARDMIARVYQTFERWIEENPGQWLCTKRRWPDLRKEKWQAMLAGNPRLVRRPGAAPPA